MTQEQRDGPEMAAAPGANQQPWQTTREVKSARKRRATKAKHPDHARSPTEVAGQEEVSPATKTLRDQDGDGSTGPTRRSRGHRHSKGGKMARGKSKGSKTPEDPKKPESLTSPAQDDGKPAESAVAATSREGGPAERVTTSRLGENGVEGVKAGFDGLPDGSPKDTRVSAKAHEGPPEVPRGVGQEHVVASSRPSGKPAKDLAIMEGDKANQPTERRKSKVAIAEAVPQSGKNEASLVGRGTSRRPSQFSRKDSTAWSTRRIDASRHSVVSTTASKVMHMALRRSKESQLSGLNPEEHMLLAAVGCAILLTLSAILASIAYHMSRARVGSAGVACDTAECRNAKDYLAGLLNLGRDTCTGFYQYVCSSWTGGNSSFAEDVGDALATKLHDALFVDTGTATTDPLGKHVAAETYRACHKLVGAVRRAPA
ncbi:uncharacterized protein LOC142586197 [Dermacentor variabilis]|uniref:uncharacterized protein LOC142586197 n=1 Tax=Dermacentor variabilis TaxID=34621 RepID=UPI003F5CAFB3